MQNQPGQTWHVGAIANSQVLTEHYGWVWLNFQPTHGGPWRPGDVVDGHAYTGVTWVELPGAWRPDPTGRFHERWWTGKAWTDDVLRNGRRYRDPLHPAVGAVPVVPAQTARQRKGFWRTVGQTADAANSVGNAFVQLLLVLYCLFWLAVVVYAGVVAYVEDDPRYLTLLAPAASQLFVAALIGKKEFRKSVKKAAPYVPCAVGATFGIWASVHFNSPQLMNLTLILFFFGMIFAWVFS